MNHSSPLRFVKSSFAALSVCLLFSRLRKARLTESLAMPHLEIPLPQSLLSTVNMCLYL